jgi:hypothetical protein
MAQEYLICDKQELVAIADAVRTKTGNTDTYTVSELPEAIEAIEAGGSGAEIETCTVEIIPPANKNDLRYLGINFNVLEDKKIVEGFAGGYSFEKGNHIIVENVICGSFIIFDHNTSPDYNILIDGEEIYWYGDGINLGNVPYKNNGTVTIELQNA